ncbi:MAG: lytic transglycosylase domain-containing protein [Saprospiraceae bacterium]
MKSISYYSIAVAAFLTFALFASYTDSDEPPLEFANFSDTHKLPQIIKPVNLNKAFDFAGEAVPMENFDAKERLDRELTENSYRHGKNMLNLKKANRYFPMIEKILAENGVPDDFKYVAVAESDLSNAVSPAGARGFWQFMRPTARDYGMEVTATVDERYHIEMSTRAACKHILKLKKIMGNWTLAAAAYNVGQNRLKREMTAQRSNNFYDLNLNHETSRYLFRILAFKAIMKNPQDFGFDLGTEGYQPLDNFAVVEVNTTIPNLGDFAQKYGTSYRMLKLYNPWLISTSLSNKSGKQYFIKIPQ